MAENSKVIASISPLRVTDPTGKQYNGFAYLNFVSTGKKNYLNILCKIKFKSKGKWKDLDQYMIMLPLPAVDMMMTWIKKTIGISRLNGKNHHKWKFKVK